MFIKALRFRGLRGFDYDIKFRAGINVLLGMNGCGKTTILELIATLTGSDLATEYLVNEQIKYVNIEVVEPGRNPIYHTLTLRDGFNREKIAEFKANLSARTSFVLTHDLYDDRCVTERREPIECQNDMLRYLSTYGIGLEHISFQAGRGASLLVSETGAQRYLLTVGMRRAPAHVPMLVENPERSLHVMLKELVHEFYTMNEKHQIIFSTHDPSTYRGIENSIRKNEKIFRDNGKVPRGVIDLSSKYVRW